MKLRSFIAFDIPRTLADELGAVSRELSRLEPRVRWVAPENMHVTIKFLGNVEEGLIKGEISDLIEEVASLSGRLSFVSRGIGAFPNPKYPRVVWAGLEGDVGRLGEMYQKLEEGLSHFGIKKEGERFVPHITLGRVRDFVKAPLLTQKIDELSQKEFGGFEISYILLYKSLLTRDGPIYTPIVRFNLGGRKDVL